MSLWSELGRPVCHLGGDIEQKGRNPLTVVIVLPFYGESEWVKKKRLSVCWLLWHTFPVGPFSVSLPCIFTHFRASYRNSKEAADSGTVLAVWRYTLTMRLMRVSGESASRPGCRIGIGLSTDTGHILPETVKFLQVAIQRRQHNSSWGLAINSNQLSILMVQKSYFGLQPMV